MSYVLLLNISGPLISSGSSDYYDMRGTSLFPRKSMVVGIIANALGRQRQDAITDIASMRYAVRTDRCPDLCTDYQTVHAPHDLYVTPREYMTNASFLCGFESDNLEFLKQILDALAHPKRPLYAGRKCCVLDTPVGLEVVSGDLEDAVTGYQRRADSNGAKYFICECRKGESPDEFIFDQPISFDERNRKFGERPVKYVAC